MQKVIKRIYLFIYYYYFFFLQNKTNKQLIDSTFSINSDEQKIYVYYDWFDTISNSTSLRLKTGIVNFQNSNFIHNFLFQQDSIVTSSEQQGNVFVLWADKFSSDFQYSINKDFHDPLCKSISSPSIFISKKSKQ